MDRVNIFITDMAIAASYACDGYFSPECIEGDIELELPVGDTLDCGQISVFLKALSGDVSVPDNYGSIDKEYDTTGIGAKIDRHDSLYDVYWDELLEILLNDNGGE